MFNFNDYRADFCKGIINPYSILKKSAQTDYRQLNYSTMFMNDLISMFEYEKSEEYAHIDDRTIELTMILNGINGWTRNENGDIVCGFAYDGGVLDVNGIGNTISINLINGKGYKGVLGVNDIVVGLNNATRTPDYDIFIYADQLSEITLSEENNIRFARLNPVYVAKNRKIATMIKEALGKLKNGEPAIISDNSMTLSSTDELIKQTAITDVNSIGKLQYLTTYYDSVIRRWGNVYGHAISDGMKQAQQSVAEVSSNESSSFIIPLDKLKQRQKMCKELENVFGGSITVKFSEAWDINYSKWKESDINVEKDNGLSSEASSDNTDKS